MATPQVEVDVVIKRAGEVLLGSEENGNGKGEKRDKYATVLSASW
jgi:hypothetical protein